MTRFTCVLKLFFIEPAQYSGWLIVYKRRFSLNDNSSTYERARAILRKILSIVIDMQKFYHFYYKAVYWNNQSINMRQTIGKQFAN